MDKTINFLLERVLKQTTRSTLLRGSIAGPPGQNDCHSKGGYGITWPSRKPCSVACVCESMRMHVCCCLSLVALLGNVEGRALLGWPYSLFPYWARVLLSECRHVDKTTGLWQPPRRHLLLSSLRPSLRTPQGRAAAVPTATECGIPPTNAVHARGSTLWKSTTFTMSTTASRSSVRTVRPCDSMAARKSLR